MWLDMFINELSEMGIRENYNQLANENHPPIRATIVKNFGNNESDLFPSQNW